MRGDRAAISDADRHTGGGKEDSSGPHEEYYDHETAPFDRHGIPFGNKGPMRTREGPTVRILFPPPVSLSQRGPTDAVGQSRGCGAGPGLVRDVRRDEAAETRRCLALFLSRLLMQSQFGKAQTGRNDVLAAVGAAVCGIYPDCVLNLRAVCAARSSPKADRVRSAVSR